MCLKLDCLVFLVKLTSVSEILPYFLWRKPSSLSGKVGLVVRTDKENEKDIYDQVMDRLKNKFLSFFFFLR